MSFINYSSSFWPINLLESSYGRFLFEKWYKYPILVRDLSDFGLLKLHSAFFSGYKSEKRKLNDVYLLYK